MFRWSLFQIAKLLPPQAECVLCQAHSTLSGSFVRCLWGAAQADAESPPTWVFVCCIYSQKMGAAHNTRALPRAFLCLSISLPYVEVGLASAVTDGTIWYHHFTPIGFSLSFNITSALLAFHAASWKLIFHFSSHFLCNTKRITGVLRICFER